MLEPVLQIKRRGLITLERARLLTGEIGPVQLPEQLGEATKLTVYVGRQERVDGTPAFVAVCDLLHRRGIAGATVLLGVDGTSRGRRRARGFFGRNADVPMMIIAVGAGERIAAVLPELGGLLQRAADHARARARLQARRRAAGTPARAARHRRARPRAVAEADGLHLARAPPTTAIRCTSRSSGGCAKPTPPARPACAASGASTATTPPTATGSCRSAATSRSCTIAIDTPERIARSFADHRRADRRARPGHQRDGAGDDRDQRDRDAAAVCGWPTTTSEPTVAVGMRRSPAVDTVAPPTPSRVRPEPVYSYALARL